MASVPLKIPRTIEVRVGGQAFKVTRGTRVKAFLRLHLPDQEPECLGALLANRLVDLEAPIGASCDLVPVTYASKEGARIYRATLITMLVEAVERVYPGMEVRVGQSFGDGYYFDVQRDPALSIADIDALEAEMRAMVDRKEPLAVMRVPKMEALEALGAYGQESTVRIARLLRKSWLPLVTMGHKVDLWYHPLLPTTEGISQFRLVPYAEGMVLMIPPPGNRDLLPEKLRNHRSLYQAYRETRDWNDRVGIATVADLNAAVVSGHVSEVIRVAEALHERKIAALADEIVRKAGCRLVLVAGPSSSGKTTSVKRMRMQLLAVGVRPKVLSVDNYYVDRDKTPLDEDGGYDFECIEAIDLPLLNQHLDALLQGSEVEMPRYSFQKGMRDERTTPLKLEPGEILLIEGIHGLNDRLTEAVPDASKIRIYLSALTQLCIDSHTRIFTSDARLLRRMVRDRLFRGYSAAQTIRQWPKVRAGEERWIFPFQEKADHVFNSTLVYEAAVLKMFAERFLMEVPETDPSFVEAIRLLEFLDLLVPVFTDDVPATSILREFIGGSAFSY